MAERLEPGLTSMASEVREVAEALLGRLAAANRTTPEAVLDILPPPQFSVSRCPGILAAERPARRLSRRCTIEQLIYSRLHAPAGHADREWKHRMTVLIESSPRPVAESGPQALFQAAACPEAIAAAAANLCQLT